MDVEMGMYEWMVYVDAYLEMGCISMFRIGAISSL